jgi:molybdate transport system regulatory protein
MMEESGGRENLVLRIRVTRGGMVVMGPGRADLLRHIQITGSIAAAGRAMRMSYKRAWALVEAMNSDFTAPLVEAAKGGAGGGGARLTALGLQVLEFYRTLQAQAEISSTQALNGLQAVIAVPPPEETG